MISSRESLFKLLWKTNRRPGRRSLSEWRVMMNVVFHHIIFITCWLLFRPALPLTLLTISGLTWGTLWVLSRGWEEELRGHPLPQQSWSDSVFYYLCLFPVHKPQLWQIKRCWFSSRFQILEIRWSLPPSVHSIQAHCAASHSDMDLNAWSIS